MDDAELYDWINKIWPSVSEKYWVSKQTSERESFVSLNEEILGDEHLFDSEDAQFIFEFLLMWQRLRKEKLNMCIYVILDNHKTGNK